MYINITVGTFFTETFIHRKIGLMKRLLSKKDGPDYFFNPEMKRKNVGNKGGDWILFFLPH